jgi:small subunit ribosomal protein S15
MARIYSGKKGKHGSKKPPVRASPKWFKMKKEEVEGLIIKLAKERYSSAVIGTILRDQYAIPNVKIATGKSVAQIMKESKLYPNLPEDMLNLLKKAVVLRQHLQRQRADHLSEKGLQNLESKIRRLGKYYSRNGVMPKDWKYDPEKAKLIVQK